MQRFVLLCICALPMVLHAGCKSSSPPPLSTGIERSGEPAAPAAVPEEPLPVETEAPKAVVSAVPAAAVSAEPDERGGGAVHSERPEVSAITIRLGADGRQVTRAGRPFGTAETVAVSALLDFPAAYDGKTVRLSGTVSSLCPDRGGWFSLAAGDESGRHLRALTMPVFEVLPDAVGTQATVEGVVELVEISSERARLLAERQGHSKPEEVTGPITNAVLRAYGAEFSSAVPSPAR